MTDASALEEEASCLDPLQDEALFYVQAPPPVSLADRFLIPPFSVLDRRQGLWQDRKRRWLATGIQSEVGRGDDLTYQGTTTFMTDLFANRGGATSIFDPVICEVVYRWFTRPGARILDPFCGGSVRGMTASTLHRRYTGIDLREEQVAANQAQLPLCNPAFLPRWLVGDATALEECLGWADAGYDLVFSCPPYADLEVYSDHPRDISNWSYPEFLSGHEQAIVDACDYLKPDRYAAWVIGDVRNPKTGGYRGLHHRTVEAFEKAGLSVINEAVILSPLGSIPVRAGAPFEANRKLANAHQHLLIFVKGDPRAAADWAKQ